MFFVLLAAAIYSGWRLATEPVASDLLMIVAIWNLINLGVAGAGLGVVAERRELRRNQRLPIRRHGIAAPGEAHLDRDPCSMPRAVAFRCSSPITNPTSIRTRTGGARSRSAAAAAPVLFPVTIRSVREFDGTNVFGFAYPERCLQPSWPSPR
jgi:cellulose synthase (UDP-forming)